MHVRQQLQQKRSRKQHSAAGGHMWQPQWRRAWQRAGISRLHRRAKERTGVPKRSCRQASNNRALPEVVSAHAT